MLLHEGEGHCGVGKGCEPLRGQRGPIHPVSPGPPSRTCMRILPSDTKGVLSSAVKMQPTKKSPSSPLKCCK